MIAGVLTRDNHLTLAHSRWGERGCILCRRAGKSDDSKFCSVCEMVLKEASPILVRVPEDNETHDDGAR